MKKYLVQLSLITLLISGISVQSCKNKKDASTETTTTTTAPVVVNDDATLRSSIDPIIKQYPNVSADVQNGKVTLRGTVNSRDDMQKIVQAVNEAQIKNFENQITVKQ
ncbi:MAG: BON domain-containing protein [Chitinophagaceae bacterium]